MRLSLLQWKFWQVTVKAFEIGHVGFTMPVGYLSGDAEQAGGRRVWGSGSVERERTQVDPRDSWARLVSRRGWLLSPEAREGGEFTGEQQGPQTEGAGRPPCWLLSVSSEPVLLASGSWLTPLHCGPPRSPGFSGDSSFS